MTPVKYKVGIVVDYWNDMKSLAEEMGLANGKMASREEIVRHVCARPVEPPQEHGYTIVDVNVAKAKGKNEYQVTVSAEVADAAAVQKHALDRFIASWPDVGRGPDPWMPTSLGDALFHLVTIWTAALDSDFGEAFTTYVPEMIEDGPIEE